MRHGLRLIAAAVLAAVTAAPAGGADEKPADDPNPIQLKLDRATDLAPHGRDEARDLAEEVLAERSATREQRIEAFRALLNYHARKRQTDKILAVCKRMTDAMPGDKEALARAAVATAGVLKSKKDGRDKAIEHLVASLPKVSGHKLAEALVRVKLAAYLAEARDYDRAYDQYAKAFATEALPHDRAADVLGGMVHVAWSRGKYEAALKHVDRLLRTPYVETLQDYERFDMRRRRVDTLRQLERYDEALRLCAALTKEGSDLRRRQSAQILLGDIWRQQKKPDKAREAYEGAFAEHTELADHWYDAQYRIAEALRDEGKHREALLAMRLCLDAADNYREIQSATMFLAEMLKAMDENVARANRLILYQKHGPAGEDGNTGTADDLTDPLAELPRPKYPAREKAFAKARKADGHSARDAGLHAQMYLFSGQPAAALRSFLDAFGKAGSNEYVSFGRDAVNIGARALQGHPHNLQRFYDYLNFGPAGPDGKPDTDDDLADPFAELLSKHEAEADKAARAALPTGDDARALRDARAMLKRWATDEAAHDNVRRAALSARTRVLTALNDFSDAEPIGWYVANLLRHPNSGHHVEAWVRAGLAGARRGQWHLGGVRAFWRALDAIDDDVENWRHSDRLRNHLTSADKQFREPSTPTPRHLKPWKVTVQKIHAGSVKPFPEPKEPKKKPKPKARPKKKPAAKKPPEKKPPAKKPSKASGKKAPAKETGKPKEK